MANKTTINSIIPAQEAMITWYDKTIYNGKSFNELFSIDEIPLGDFYTVFFGYYSIPRCLSYTESDNLLIKMYHLSRTKISSFCMKKILLHKELLRISLPGINAKNSDSNPTDVLFLTHSNHFHENTIFRLNNILDYLQQNNLFSYKLLVAENLSTFKFTRLDYPLLYSYVDLPIIKMSQKKAKLLYKQISALNTSTNLFKKVTNNLPLNAVSAYEFFFSEEMLTLIHIYYYTCKKIISSHNIKLVVTTGTSSLAERCILLASRKLQRKCILIEHAINAVFPPSYKAVYNPYTTVMLSLVSEKKGMIQSKILPPSKIYLSGPMIFDDIVQYANAPLPPRTNIPKVLIATSPYVEEGTLSYKEYMAQITIIINILVKQFGCEVILKPHPRENIHKYRQYCSDQVKLVNSKMSRTNFYATIAESSLFIHFCSTAIYEAIIINRPIITFNMGLEIAEFGSFSNLKKSSIYIDNINDFKQAISSAFNAPLTFVKENKMYVTQNIGTIDGKAYEEIAKMIKKSISKN